MNAAPDVQLRLLELQEADSALDRLAQRRRTLPELAEIERIDARLAALRDEIVAAETELSDVALAERRIDNDVEVVRTRMARDRQRLDTGAVGSPKELESLQHEIESLGKRQAELEDLELEQMELREGVEKRLAGLRAEAAELTEAKASAESGRDLAYGDIDAEAAERRTERDALAAELAGPLLDLYEKLRASSGGQGAAALHRGRCEGCHLTLSPVDLDRIKKAPEDEVLRCEECRRILIRRD